MTKHERHSLLYESIPSRDGNTKHENLVFRVSCFVYIDTNTRTPSQNTKQTRKKVETRNKHEKLKNLHVLLDLFSTIIFHWLLIETLMLVSFNWISCYLLMWLYTIFFQLNLSYNKQFFIWLYKIFQFKNTKHEKNTKFWNDTNTKSCKNTIIHTRC